MQRFKCMCVTDSITALGVITLEPFIADSLSVPRDVLSFPYTSLNIQHNSLATHQTLHLHHIRQAQSKRPIAS